MSETENGENGSADLMPREAHKRLIENVKMLALQHGITEAARIAGVKRSTVKSWARRYDWQIPRANTPKLQPLQPALANPAETLRSHLFAYKARSSLALSSYLASTSEKLDGLPDAAKLSSTRRAKDLGDLHGRLFPAEAAPNSIVNIAIVTGQRRIERASLPEAN